MDQIASEFLARVKDRLDQTTALGRLSPWITKHTTRVGKPFSFEDHEFQVGIIDDKAHDLVCMKPSQVGLSETMCRLTLAFLAVTQGINAMVTFPTINEALRFSKSRIDPVVRGSTALSNLLLPGSDNAAFKQFGDSQLYMAGTFGKALISIPVDILINDELDFSNPEALTTAESRLTHSQFVDEATGLRGIKRRFSTPTAEGVGVSAIFERSDKMTYQCRCQKCGHWFRPEFLTHVVVDGFDDSFDRLTYMDVARLDEEGKLSTARILCEKCRQPLTRENLAAPYRAWVPQHFDRTVRGYSVSPFDLPKYHTPESIMRKMYDYRGEVGHFRNFVLGLPYSDASNSILKEMIEAHTILTALPPEQAMASGISGCVIGVDVGKVSWLVVGRRVGQHMHILWWEQISIRNSSNGAELREIVTERIRQYRACRVVIDGMPYTSDSMAIAANFPPEVVYLSMFTLTDRKLPTYVTKEDNPELSVNRTKALNHTATQVNSGLVKFAQHPQMHVAIKHMTALKRIDRKTAEGEEEQHWVSSGDDHYGFALTYLLLADLLAQGSFMVGWAPTPGITQAHLGSRSAAA